MTLTPDIIKEAYRESNLIAQIAEPSAGQTTEALPRLNSIVSGAYGYEVGRQLIDWPVGQEGVTNDDAAAYWTNDIWAYPPANMRLIAASSTPQTIYLHPQPSDGARMALIDPGARLAAAPITVDGNGRTVQGAATQVNSVDSVAKIWFYRADLGDWVLLSLLTAADDEEFPFPIEFDDYFITMLAMRLNPRYGRSLNEASVAALARTLEKLRARYTQATKVAGPAGAASLTLGFGARRMPNVNGDVGSTRGSRVMRPPHYEG